MKQFRQQVSINNSLKSIKIAVFLFENFFCVFFINSQGKRFGSDIPLDVQNKTTIQCKIMVFVIFLAFIDIIYGQSVVYRQGYHLEIISTDDQNWILAQMDRGDNGLFESQEQKSDEIFLDVTANHFPLYFFLFSRNRIVSKLQATYCYVIMKHNRTSNLPLTVHFHFGQYSTHEGLFSKSRKKINWSLVDIELYRIEKSRISFLDLTF